MIIIRIDIDSLRRSCSVMWGRGTWTYLHIKWNFSSVVVVISYRLNLAKCWSTHDSSHLRMHSNKYTDSFSVNSTSFHISRVSHQGRLPLMSRLLISPVSLKVNAVTIANRSRSCYSLISGYHYKLLILQYQYQSKGGNCWFNDT